MKRSGDTWEYCDETCKPCIYSTFMSIGGIACVYILAMGKQLGCKHGAGCEKREIGKKKPSVDLLLFLGRDAKRRAEAERAAKKKAYNREYYQRRKEDIKAKSKRQYAEVKERKKKDPVSWGERKAITRARTQRLCQGRQKAVIEAYLAENEIGCVQLALMLGVHESTVRKWKNEYNLANWEKLAQVGIRRPEGL